MHKRGSTTVHPLAGSEQLIPQQLLLQAKRRAIDPPGAFPTMVPQQEPRREENQSVRGEWEQFWGNTENQSVCGEWDQFWGNTVEGEGVDGRVGDGDDSDAVCAHLHGGGAPRHLRRRQRQCGGAGKDQGSGLWVTGPLGFMGVYACDSEDLQIAQRNSRGWHSDLFIQKKS